MTGQTTSFLGMIFAAAWAFLESLGAVLYRTLRNPMMAAIGEPPPLSDDDEETTEKGEKLPARLHALTRTAGPSLAPQSTPTMTTTPTLPPSSTGRLCTSCETAESAPLKLKKCTGCRSVQYCCQDCQRDDWPAHKSTCRRLQQEAHSKMMEAVFANDVVTVKALMTEGFGVGIGLLYPSLHGAAEMVEALLDNTHKNAANTRLTMPDGRYVAHPSLLTPPTRTAREPALSASIVALTFLPFVVAPRSSTPRRAAISAFCACCTSRARRISTRVRCAAPPSPVG